MANEFQLEWMIRDSSNKIRGPFKQSEVVQLIKKGQLKGKSEISRANAYWFSLDEKAELARFLPELGIAAPEPVTQMTATLTHAEAKDQEIENTQFVEQPSREDLKSEEAQWLNDEMAAEFMEGIEDAPSLAMQTRTDLKASGAQEKQTPVIPELNNKDLTEEVATEPTENAIIDDLLKRATVKADTLPSEMKGIGGERPKPISAMLRPPQDKSASAIGKSSHIVSVPTEVPEAHARIILEEEEESSRQARAKVKKTIAISLSVILLAGGGFAAWKYLVGGPQESKLVLPIKSTPDSLELTIRKSLIFSQLEYAKQALSELELDPEAKGKVILPIANALLKKEFLYDSDGAVMSLQTARTLSTDSNVQREVDNLIAIYRFDRDPDSSIEQFRRLLEANPNDLTFHHNFSLSLLRAGRFDDAFAAASKAIGSQKSSGTILSELNFILGWASESRSKGLDITSEVYFSKALEANPFSEKARLALAVSKFRREGIKLADTDFRLFVDSLPDLDPPNRVLNYRLMGSDEFYTYARNEIRNLHGPLGLGGSKPSPLVMAVDAVISCIQNRTGEANKILEGAMGIAPGDPYLLKAMGYSRWKDGRYPEVVDLLKDQPREKLGFPGSQLIGRAYLKQGKADFSQAYFEYMTTIAPQHPASWSLLGESFLLQGKSDQARIQFKNALSKDPQDLIALRGLDKLGEQFDKSLLQALPF